MFEKYKARKRREKMDRFEEEIRHNLPRFTAESGLTWMSMYNHNEETLELFVVKVGGNTVGSMLIHLDQEDRGTVLANSRSWALLTEQKELSSATRG